MMNFQKARQNTKDLFSSLSASAKAWKRLCIIQGVTILILVTGLCFLASLSKPYPWIVQVDEHGYDVSIGQAGKQEIDLRIIISRIGRFIESARTVVSDPKAQRALIDWTYISIPDGSPALATTNAYYRENDPFKLMQRQQTVQVTVKSVLPISDKTFRAEWTEAHIKNGTPEETQSWTGLFTIGITPTRDIQAVIKNPLGIYITEYQATRNYN